MIDRIPSGSDSATVADVGCSTGYMLEDLQARFPHAQLIGIDFILSGLRAARETLPCAVLMQADAEMLPLAQASMDIIVSANLLEHVPDDVEALRQMHRAAKPGATVVLVVPAGRRLFDYYDRFLHHQRRYGRYELAGKARAAGFVVLEDVYLGTLIYPPFWLIKKRNRLFRDHLEGVDLERRVALDIKNTRDSPIGHLTVRIERVLLGRAIRIPFGVRELVVLGRPLWRLDPARSGT